MLHCSTPSLDDATQKKRSAPAEESEKVSKAPRSQGCKEVARYTRESILRSEFIYGYGFQAPKGLETTKQLSKGLGLSPGMSVLDMGCGTGGASFYIAETFGCHVVGVDIQHEMVGICRERNEEGGLGCTFKPGSMLDATLFSAETFDVIWIRDAYYYLESSSKDAALRNFWRWLKPGGLLMITDYGKGPTPGPKFEEYCALGVVTMEDIEAYQARLESSAFVIELARTMPEFGPNYQEDLDSFQKRQAEFVLTYGSDYYKALEARWSLKCAAIREGGFVGLHFHARKP